MLARNRLFARLAASASCFALSSSLSASTRSTISRSSARFTASSSVGERSKRAWGIAPNRTIAVITDTAAVAALSVASMP